jgi:hypothetical protein
MCEFIIDAVGTNVDRVMIRRIDSIVDDIAGVRVAPYGPMIPGRFVRVVVLRLERKRRMKLRCYPGRQHEDGDRKTPQSKVEVHLA